MKKIVYIVSTYCAMTTYCVFGYNFDQISSKFRSLDTPTINVSSSRAKIGVIDLDYILTNLTYIKNMNLRLEDTLRKAEAKLTNLESQLKNEYKIGANKTNVSQDEIQQSAKIYNDKVTEYQLLLQEVKSKLSSIRAHNLKVIKTAISEAIKIVSTRESLDLVLYKEHLAFVSNDLDISTEIMKIIEKQTLNFRDEKEVLNDLV